MKDKERPGEMPDSVLPDATITFSSVEDLVEDIIYKEYMLFLNEAHLNAQKALDALYNEKGPKRNFWLRWQLGRAQSILISMYANEMKRLDPRN